MIIQVSDLQVLGAGKHDRPPPQALRDKGLDPDRPYEMSQFDLISRCWIVEGDPLFARTPELGVHPHAS